MTLLERFNAVFQQFPDRHAFCIEDKYYTYRELAIKVASIKKLISQYDKEENIGIMVRNDLESYASLMAILFSGKTYIPINPNHPVERTENIIKQLDLKVVLSRPNGHALPGIEMVDHTADAGVTEPEAFDIPEFDQRTKNAYILFTSGSTGVPKGVQITHHNLNSLVEASLELGYGISETDRFLQMADLTFDLSVFAYIVPLCIGACICTIPAQGIKFTNVYRVLKEHDVTFAVMVPSTLSHLRPYFDEISLPHLKHSLFCGEALYKDVTIEWMKCAPNMTVENMYGPTEATVFCMGYHIDDPTNIIAENGIIGIGTAIQNMDFIVIDDELNVLPDGEKGELCIAGEQLTPGYLDEERNKVAFFMYNNKRYYRTGDIAYMGKEGIYMFAGRADHQVKIQGYRIELSEVEFHLRKIAGKSGAVALVRKGANGMDQLEAVFEDKNTDVENVYKELKTKLPSYMIPSRIHVCAPFPMNANGKTDRLALAKMIRAES
jgi:D-alanine--poly(phosphoribitol) ligase subunit 1